MENFKSGWSSLPRQDFHQWLTQTSSQMNTDKLSKDDVKQLCRVLKSMAIDEELKIKSTLRLLLLQLLKWQHQPQNRCHRWIEIMSEYRYQLNDYFSASPTLKEFAESALFDCYQAACTTMSIEDHVPVEHFPAESFPKNVPFSMAEISDLNYFPK
ncbi:protein of unknown function DUF29 [[Leptolyngbya] sp. PCC 7376]|uniref:DUF29 family protein n=1 Tax=[Leptolyngbya] sp. PCC 7376 TaxID=111781 RepID=UPI00029EF0AF|nr:DUF29 family protein [[Leptolyngbya] sp. PCC 7376]AFY36810.1 protein of unknown function DUF29 [[Leptolyngbya] sp. PCC 7376]